MTAIDNARAALTEWDATRRVPGYEPAPISALRDLIAEYERLRAVILGTSIEWVGRAWDDGNASGLDGWVGPGRGTEPVDREAVHARTRLIHRADAALFAALEAAEAAR